LCAFAAFFPIEKESLPADCSTFTARPYSTQENYYHD
jgi:hypothetical protein